MSTLNIHQRINCNAAHPVHALKGIAKTLHLDEKDFVNQFRSKCYELGMIPTWVKASKRMRKEMNFIGVGLWLRNERP